MLRFLPMGHPICASQLPGPGSRKRKMEVKMENPIPIFEISKFEKGNKNSLNLEDHQSKIRWSLAYYGWTPMQTGCCHPFCSLAEYNVFHCPWQAQILTGTRGDLGCDGLRLFSLCQVDQDMNFEEACSGVSRRPPNNSLILIAPFRRYCRPSSIFHSVSFQPSHNNPPQKKLI